MHNIIKKINVMFNIIKNELYINDLRKHICPVILAVTIFIRDLYHDTY